MGLADDLAEVGGPDFGVRCATCAVLLRLDADDRTALEAALADESKPGSAIARTLRAHGHKVRDDSVRRHRRENCGGS